MKSKQVHFPVLKEEVISSLLPDLKQCKRIVWVDGTIGAGGHAAALMEAVAETDAVAWVIGIDRDSEMLKFARQRLHDFFIKKHQLHLVHDTYANLPEILAQVGVKASEVNCVLLDLGVNSYQLDDPTRGFSFRQAGPLDMRFNRESDSSSLEQYLTNVPEEDLARHIRVYGEERWAKNIARNIKKAILEDEVKSTEDLSSLVAATIPKKFHPKRIHPATKTFQALRIALNEELKQLEIFLSEIPNLLSPKARLGIISFHSLEDRMVKDAFRTLTKSASLPKELPLREDQMERAKARLLTRKAIKPTEEEAKENPRARSARYRVLEML